MRLAKRWWTELWEYKGGGLMPWTGTAIVCDSGQLTGAASLVEWTEEPIATGFCEVCGVGGCGGLEAVVLRRLSDLSLLVWLPDFLRWLPAEAGAWHDHQPPELLRSEALAFEPSALRGLCPTLPEPGQVRPLSAGELYRLIQLEAPGRVFGTLPEPVAFAPESLLAAELEMDPPAVAAWLTGALAEPQERAEEPVRLRALKPGERMALVFFDRVDSDRFHEWPGIVETADGLQLGGQIEGFGDFVVELEEGQSD